MHSSMRAIGYASRTFTEFNWHYSTQKRNYPSFSGTNTIGDDHYVCATQVPSFAACYRFPLSPTLEPWGWSCKGPIGCL